MRRPVDVGRELVGDELGHLGVLFPGLRHFERLAEFGLIGRLQLGIPEHVRPVVERELVAVVEDAPPLPLVEGDRLVKRMIVVEIRLVHVFRDIVVDRDDDPAVGEGRYPRRLDVQDVVGAGIGDVLGDRLGILVGMRQLDDIVVHPRQRLPERTREVLGLESLKPGLIGHVEGDALVLLRGLHGTIGRAVGRPLRGGLDGRILGLAQRRALVGELDLGEIHCRGPGIARGGGVSEPGQHRGPSHQHQPRQELPARAVPPEPGIDLFAQARMEIASFTLVHGRNPPCCLPAVSSRPAVASTLRSPPRSCAPPAG